MRAIVAACCFAGLFTAKLSAQDYWIQLDSVNGAGKSVSAAFAAGGQGYIVSGLESGGFTRKMYSYDVVQNDWDNELAIGGLNGGGLSRGSACAFSIYDKGYVCLGQGDNTNFLGDVWEYDPVLDVWSQKADYAGSPRRGAVAFVIGGVAYVGTGEDATGLRKDFFKYDPQANVWGNIADFGGTPRRQAVGFAMGNQGYVGTGDDGTLRNDFWQYQVFQNSWTQKASFPGTPRSGATGWGIFPNGYIATGEDNGWNYCNDIWEYNYFNNAWVQRTSLPASGRKHAVSFVIGNVAYLGTGYNGNLMDDFYSYQGITSVQSNTLPGVQMDVYPVPSVGSFHLRYQESTHQSLHLQILDVRGADVSDAFSVTQAGDEWLVTPTGNISGTFTCLLVNEQGVVCASGRSIVADNR